MVIQPGRRVLTLDPFVRISRRAVEVPAGGNWWEAGSAPTPLAVYQPKGAASLSASYVNLVNPGTYDAAPGDAPSWSSAGWAMNGSSNYLTTGVVPVSDGAVLVRFADAVSSNGRVLIGCVYGGYHALGSYWYGDQIYFANGSAEEVASPSMSSGVLAFAGTRVYRDGVDSHGISGLRIAGTDQYLIGAYQTGFWFQGTIIAVAIWDTSTDHATWMPEVMDAVALI